MYANQSIHPIMNDERSSSISRTNAYPPPLFGIELASSAYDSPVNAVTTPFSAKTTIAAGPAISAASPVSTKMPAPIISPMPIIVASSSPSSASGERVLLPLMGRVRRVPCRPSYAPVYRILATLSLGWIRTGAESWWSLIPPVGGATCASGSGRAGIRPGYKESDAEARHDDPVKTVRHRRRRTRRSPDRGEPHRPGPRGVADRGRRRPRRGAVRRVPRAGDPRRRHRAVDPQAGEPGERRRDPGADRRDGDKHGDLYDCSPPRADHPDLSQV